MTYKSEVVDDRGDPVSTNCGMARYGSVRTTVINGADSPPGKRTENALTLTRAYTSYRPITWSHHTPAPPRLNQSGESVICGFAPSPNFQVWTGSDEITLVAKLASKTRGHKFNAAVSILESRESLETIAKRARTIAAAIALTRKGRFRKALQVLTDRRRVTGYRKVNRRLRRREYTYARKVEHRDSIAASVWLEINFGWMPIVSDIQEALKAFDSNRSDKTSVRVRHSVPGLPGAGGGFNAGGYSARRGQIIARYTKTETAFASMSLDNIPLALWAKLPFSFLADWAVPVSAYLTARKFAHGVEGTFVTTKTDVYDLYQGFNSSYNTIDLGLGCTRRYTYVKRDIASSLSVPSPTLTPPKKWLDSLWRATTSLSLIVQAVRS